MPAGRVLRSHARYFVSLTATYLRTYRIGDYVDGKINGAVCNSIMPHKFYHGRAGNVSKQAIGDEVKKQAMPLDYISPAPKLPYRYLSTSTVDPEGSAAKKPVEVDLKVEEKAEESHQTDPTGKPIRRGPVTWLSLLLLILTGAGLIFYYDNEKKRHIEELNAASTAVKQGPSVGKAAIGGPFKLVNHDGISVTDRDFVGKWTLIYFGFTHCPDICPDELLKLAAAVDKMRTMAGIEIVPVFISVDPERDTVEQVREYVKEFHPKLIGLTGSSEEVRQVARAYRVYYMKTEEEGSDYLVDHSIVMYLMDPDMQFVKFFGKNYDVDALVEGVIKEVKQYKK